MSIVKIVEYGWVTLSVLTLVFAVPFITLKGFESIVDFMMFITTVLFTLFYVVKYFKK